jgi:hypothetical protein
MNNKFNYEQMENNMIIHHRISWKELQIYNYASPLVPFPKGISIFTQYKN